MKTRSWTYLNELSGKEWIPDDTVPGKPGWYEDVPHRLYLGTPWLFFTISPHRPWLSVQRRSKPPRPRRTHVVLILRALNPEITPALRHFLERREDGLALVEALAQEAQRTDYLDYDVDSEVEAILSQWRVDTPLKRALRHQLNKFKGVVTKPPLGLHPPRSR